jgi:hypothetical protein
MSAVSHAAPPRHGNAGLRALDLRNLPIVLVLALGATGIVYSAAVPRHWLRGVLLLAVACAIAGLCRLLLPVRQAGLLVVRGRATDVVCYVGLAVAIIALGLALPA